MNKRPEEVFTSRRPEMCLRIQKQQDKEILPKQALNWGGALRTPQAGQNLPHRQEGLFVPVGLRLPSPTQRQQADKPRETPQPSSSKSRDQWEPDSMS